MGRDANCTISLIASYDRRLKRPLPASNLITGSQKNKCSQGSLIWTQWTCQVPRNHLIVVRFRRERTQESGRQCGRFLVPSQKRTVGARVARGSTSSFELIWRRSGRVRVRWSSTLSRISPLRNYCPMLWVTSIWNKEGVLYLQAPGHMCMHGEMNIWTGIWWRQKRAGPEVPRFE